jgi:multidrug efflux system membrane fusion protein
MRNRNKVALLLVAVVAAGAIWLFGGHRPSPQTTAPTGPGGAPVPVTAATASRHDVPIYLEGLGNIQAYNTVLVRPQVDGQLMQIAFKEGQEVRAGDLLAQIDPRTYQASFDQAVAKKAQDEAQLANARLDLQRYAGLVEKNYVARQQLDTTRAQVAQLEAAVAGDAAAIDTARVMLGYTTIRAPIAGRVGIRQVDVGNILHASDSSGIVVISQMRPISAIFTLPEDSLPHLSEAIAAGPVKIAVLSRDGKHQFDEGVLALVDNQVDPSTGTLRLKADLPNAAGRLWPGQFVNVRLRVAVLPQVLAVPASAVQRGPDGALAYIVKNDGTVEARKLTVSEISEGMAVIDDGINEGESVVTAGQYRLQPGARVQTTVAADEAAKRE